MNSKILSLNDPVIYTYNIYGSIFSILSDDPAIWPWVYNNFIQIKYVPDWNSYFFDHHHLLFDNCPWLNHYIIPRKWSSDRFNGSIVDCIIHSIDNGMYLYFYVDRFYLSMSEHYRKAELWHEILVYGYDRASQTIYIADNLADGKYIKTECSFEEMEQGYWSIHADVEFYHNIHLFERHPEEGVAIDPTQILATLGHYLHSTPSVNMFIKEHTIYGIQAMDFMLDNINGIIEQEKFVFLDKRAFHLFMEHKILMEMRLMYLKEHSPLYVADSIIKEYAPLKDDYRTLRNIVLKYNVLQKNDKLLLNIKSRLQSAIEKEKGLIGMLLTQNT